MRKDSIKKHKKEYSIEEVSTTLNISISTIKRYVDTFYEYIGIELEEFNYLFSKNKVEKIKNIRNLLKKPSYIDIKQLLEDEKKWKKFNGIIHEHRDIFGRFGVVLSGVGVLLGAYAVIKDELIKKKEIKKLNKIEKVYIDLRGILEELNREKDSDKPKFIRLKLRRKPRFDLSFEERNAMLKERGFYDKWKNNNVVGIKHKYKMKTINLIYS